MYGLDIPEIMINIISCHGFKNLTILIAILTCISALVLYYLPKYVFVLEKQEGKFENIPEQVLNQINAPLLHDKDSILMCRAAIPSIVKILNKIVIPRDLYDYF